MSIRRKIAITHVAFGVVGIVIGLATDWSPQDHLPRGVNSFLLDADQFELLSLDPMQISAKRALRMKADGPQFHDYLVLGKTEIPKGPKRRNLIESIENGIADHGPVAGCFYPRHGINAVSGKHSVQLVICYQCDRIQIFRDGKRVTSPTPQPDLDKILTDSGVTLAPKEAAPEK